MNNETSQCSYEGCANKEVTHRLKWDDGRITYVCEEHIGWAHTLARSTRSVEVIEEQEARKADKTVS